MSKKSKEQKEVIELRRKVEALQAQLSQSRKEEPVERKIALPVNKITYDNNTSADVSNPTSDTPRTIFLTDVHYLKHDLLRVALLSVIIIASIVAIKFFTPL